MVRWNKSNLISKLSQTRKISACYLLVNVSETLLTMASSRQTECCKYTLHIFDSQQSWTHNLHRNPKIQMKICDFFGFFVPINL